MKLIFAGGIGEYGRNCFFVEGESLSFLVDCGVEPGGDSPFPRLTDRQAAKAQYLFLTHAHKDHTGALGWLIKKGFHGKIFASEPTLAVLPPCGLACTALETMSEPLAECGTLNPLCFCWGRSGHCFGSVWFQFWLDGKSLVFSGDYYEKSKYFVCDKLRRRVADVALIDHANGLWKDSTSAMRRKVVRQIEKIVRHNGTVLLPVPKNGRGTELLWILSVSLPEVPIYADMALRKAWRTSSAEDFWRIRYVIPYPVEPPGHALTEKTEKNHPDGCILMVADSHLVHKANAAFVQRLLAKGGVVLLTGHAEEGSFAAELLRDGRAQRIRYPAHQGIPEYERVCKNNNFQKVFAIHSGDFDKITDYEL